MPHCGGFFGADSASDRTCKTVMQAICKGVSCRYTVEDKSDPPLSHYVKEWLEKGAAANKEERTKAIPKAGPKDSK